MFKNMNSEGHVSDGKRSSSPAGPLVTPVAFVGQESSWIGLLSRTALSLLRKLRLWSAAPAELRSSIISEEREFLRQLNDMMPFTPPGPTHVTDLRAELDGAAGTGSALPWMAAASLQDVGIRNSEEMELCQQTPIGYLSPVRTILNQVLVSSQELQSAGGKAWVSVSGSAGKGGPWWGSLERGLLSEPARAEEDTETDRLCSETSSLLEEMVGEHTGAHLHKEESAHSGGLHTVQNTGRSIVDQLRGSKGQNPPPEQDNGYNSIEEELSQMKAPSEEQDQQDPHRPETEAAPQEEEQTSSEEDGSEGLTVLSAPQCQNKAIAFIIGCPCSDDSSQSDSNDDDDDEDDDGFDSEGSSDLSDSSDEDEEDSDSDSEPDSESERLWTSLGQSGDPYNPRNFTAHLHTGSAQHQTFSTCPQSSPVPPPCVTSPAPPSPLDVWDDSTSASEVDEAESLHLLSSFSCSSDPYSLLNFQAPLRTQGPIGPPSTAKIRNNPVPQTPPFTSQYNPASPPEYRKEEAEERLDSGFSEAPASSRARSCRSSKKVRFSDDVEEFFASCGEEEEDRRGPWEELARDRCRFLRRCQEVDQSIGYCLQPQHRRQVFQRLAILYKS